MTIKKSVLLVNLGSPERPDTGSIRRYLKTFLSDPRVMDMPSIIRWLVLHIFILPFRPRAIREKYERIWNEDGFLLIRNSKKLVEALSVELGEEYLVEIAMRYSTPSIKSALQRIVKSGVSDLLVIPLFPQYASATSGSILEYFFDAIKTWIVFPRITVLPQFHSHPGFIHAWAEVAKEYLQEKPDHILFSFHGLPEKHILKADPSGTQCLHSHQCCDELHGENHHCYRAQCFQTARNIADAVGINEKDYSVAFQSRLGKAKWIEPYTSEVIDKLGSTGVQNLLVLCPSFVADCLETVEEIGVAEKERFLLSGGQELTLVPSLNAENVWVDALVDMIRQNSM
jgi:ferrochelatase